LPSSQLKTLSQSQAEAGGWHELVRGLPPVAANAVSLIFGLWAWENGVFSFFASSTETFYLTAEFHSYGRGIDLALRLPAS